MDPAVAIVGGPVSPTYDVAAPGGSVYGLFVDLAGGPFDLFGERFYLGLTPAVVPLRTGVMAAAGTVAGSYTVPLVPGLAGVVLFGQVVVLDAAAQNGQFRVSGGASTTFHTGAAVVAAFDNPVADGFTGSYASDLAGHVRGGPITTRTHRTIDPVGLYFAQPIVSPLSPHGVRQQLVYRPQNVGASGQPELLTAVRWHAHPSIAVTPDTHASFELRIGHSAVTPDYAIDPWSALPAAPLSGLSLTFAANSPNAAAPQLAFAGSYVVDPAHQLPGGYMPYPIAAPFRYDGVSSLLLEFRLGPGTATMANGGVVYLMVQSSPFPFSRVQAVGTSGNVVLPASTPQATSGDNAMHDLELEFRRVETDCVSPWLDSQSPAPDWQAPILAASQPAGTSTTVEFRGSTSAAGTNPTAWSASQDVADGKRFLQFRLVFRANLVTGERPVVDTLVVPHQ
jgi:hypothetical protein